MPDVMKVGETATGRDVVEILMVDSSGDEVTGLVDADFTGWLIKDGSGAAAGNFAETDAT